jgi:multiple sugar transport system permease protein
VTARMHTGSTPVAPASMAQQPRERLQRRPAWQRTFLVPLVLVLVTTTIVPMLYMIALSLGDPEGQLTLGTLHGFGNYQTMLASSSVWKALGLAVIFLIGALFIELIVGIGTALLLDRLMPGSTLVRTLLLWPAVLPPIAVALVFKFLLQGDIGLISFYLSKVGINQAWLTQPSSAMGVIIAIDAWQYTPFVVLLALAALTTVSDDIREAAALDGAGPLKQARYIVIPVIAPAIVAIALLRFIDAIQVFPTIYVLTRGGPGSSTQLLTYYNFQAFFGELRFGYGAAIALLVVAFTLASVILLLQWQRRVEEAS